MATTMTEQTDSPAKLIELSEHGDGWQWTLDEDGFQVIWRSDKRGQGLFRRTFHENSWHQTHGSMQFAVPRTRKQMIHMLVHSWAVVDATITDQQIRGLRDEAVEHGDLGQVVICDRALAGDDAARAECQRVVDDTRAMSAADDE